MSNNNPFVEFEQMDKGLRLQILKLLCKKSLEIWNEFTTTKNVDYVDSLVGIHHHVKIELPKRAMLAISEKISGNQIDPKPIENDYMEPITAMQDDDLQFPDNIEYAYYSIYNLFSLVFDLNSATKEKIIFNQAFSANMRDSIDIETKLNELWLSVKNELEIH